MKAVRVTHDQECSVLIDGPNSMKTQPAYDTVHPSGEISGGVPVWRLSSDVAFYIDIFPTISFTPRTHATNRPKQN